MNALTKELLALQNHIVQNSLIGTPLAMTYVRPDVVNASLDSHLQGP